MTRPLHGRIAVRSFFAFSVLLSMSLSVPVLADPPAGPIELVVPSGRPLRVALDSRIRLKQVGQPVTATLVEPLYAYDRVVVPAGATVLGHVARLDAPSKGARIRAALAGSFSPPRHVVLQFDAVRLADGRELPVNTVAGPAIARVSLQVAAAPAKGDGKEPAADGDSDEKSDGNSGLTARAREEISKARQEATQRTRDAIQSLRAQGKMERLKAAAIDRLPYHPQFLAKGAVYDADLVVPLDFGPSAPAARASAGDLPAPESVLTARLVTAIDSAKTAKGAPIVAVLTEPVFSADHQLILPEGAELKGQVTLSRKARHFHRNGQLRFLFQSVRAPGEDSPAPMLASLYSAQVNQDDHVSIDEEGGARATSSKTRFIAPAIAILSLRASLEKEPRKLDNDPDDTLGPQIGTNPGALGVGGFFGWGLAGTAVTFVSRPAGVALGAVGAARSIYSAVFGRGRDVSFPVDTPIQVQLAPHPSSKP